MKTVSRIRLFVLVTVSVAVLGVFSSAFGQASGNAEASEIAKKSIENLGGEKFTGLKSLVSRGKVNITMPAFGQSIPATFYTVIKGEKYRIEIDNPFQPFQQAYNGETTTDSLNAGLSFPPYNLIGFPLLQHVGKDGFVVSALDGAKKKYGFRVTSPEGYYSDFYVDKDKNEIKGYDAAYTTNGREVTTSVTVKEYQLVEGAKFPKRFDQRFDLGPSMTIYAEYSSIEVLVDQPIDDSVFTIG